MAAPQGQSPQVAATGAVLDRGHQALAAAEGIRRLLTTQNLPLGPEQRGIEMMSKILHLHRTEEHGISGQCDHRRNTNVSTSH